MIMVIMVMTMVTITIVTMTITITTMAVDNLLCMKNGGTEWTREGSIRKGFGSWFLPR